MKKITWAFFVILCVSVAFYPALYFILDRKFALLGSKTPALLVDVLWNTAFYTHIILGGIALLIGWTQFLPKFRKENIRLHRQVGKLYIISVALSGISGLYIAQYATGGKVSVWGFSALAVVWLYTNFRAYTAIRRKDIRTHEAMMIYNYAATFAAVTLRLWLPILVPLYGGIAHFNEAYRVIAWLCWVPNIIVAYGIVQQRKKI
ncbi:MAG: DUF2306 domain-containing protein [Bacteroidetes bacterium]|nr:MAG: DUF2306 domain-containing protein [Bacteroidota bacterium]